MSLKKLIRFYPVFIFFLCCGGFVNGQTAMPVPVPLADTPRTDPFFTELLLSHPGYFDAVLGDSNYRVQLVYTRIDRGANGIAGLKNFYFRVNPGQYFNPALAVKLPIAMLTLQKLGGLRLNGIDKNTTMLTGKAYNGQTAVYNEPTAPSGKPTIAQYLKKLLLAGDEDACNRLYEFLGQQYINDQLHQKGYVTAQILRKFGQDNSPDEDRHTNPVTFYAPGNRVLYEQAAQYNAGSFEKSSDTDMGAAFLNMNRISLTDLHNMLVSVIFPNKVTSAQRFALSDDDRKYLLKYMSEWPTESINPPYSDDTAKYYPAFSKYLLYGSERDSVANNIRIFNVSGWERGQVIDVAYIVDYDKKMEFFLSAAIGCANEEDGQKTGLPFMKHLGEVIYEYETKRDKKIQPDLGDVKFEYDGR